MNLWSQCISLLETRLSAKDFNTFIRPLQAIEVNNNLKLFAPNKFVLDTVKNEFQETIEGFLKNISNADSFPQLTFEIGSLNSNIDIQEPLSSSSTGEPTRLFNSGLNPNFTFDTFVEGKSNQFARAASMQIGHNPGQHNYNPLYIYGDVGLGKTHLMHAVGNAILCNNPRANVLYLNSEQFVSDMVRAIRNNKIDDFKRKYRSLNALLLDDVQFFGGKDRTQEEFFHTFNALFEMQQQIVISCDRFPKEIPGLEERLKSRFGWGLTVNIEPPDLETRVAILQSKAILKHKKALPDEVAFFIGKRIHSNIRELEGALSRVIANADFMGREITLEFTKRALKDQLAAYAKQITIENIQKTVSEYYKIRVSDLLSAKRTRSITRPRQIAMSLAKELTDHSLPEIGAAFGGRDHTTVLHATRKIVELRNDDPRVEEDYENLLRTLST